MYVTKKALHVACEGCVKWYRKQEKRSSINKKKVRLILRLYWLVERKLDGTDRARGQGFGSTKIQETTSKRTCKNPHRCQCCCRRWLVAVVGHFLGQVESVGRKLKGLRLRCHPVERKTIFKTLSTCENPRWYRDRDRAAPCINQLT